MKKTNANIKTFDPRKSIRRAGKIRRGPSVWTIDASKGQYLWRNNIEKVALIRNGLPFDTIEAIGNKANMPVSQILRYLGIPQTTYNKKKRDNDFLRGRDSELIMSLSEVLDYGLAVFNHEKDKFQRWLNNSNASLGDVSPESLFDSITGIQEVRNALNRLEYGNLA